MTQSSQTASRRNRTGIFASEFKRGAAAIAPPLAAVVAYGLVFGAQASQKGLSLVEVPLMTGLNYAGGSEFAAVGLWGAPPPLLLIAGVTFLINSRHLVMGSALAPFLRYLPRWKAMIVLFFMSDETWAVSYADTLKRAENGHAQPFSLGFYAACGGLVYIGWLCATTLGALAGPLLGDVEALGFDMAFPAVFLVIVAGMYRSVAGAVPWLASLIVGVFACRFVPGAWYVVIATAAGLGIAFLLARTDR